MRRAIEIARGSGLQNVGTEHIVLAILEDAKAIPTQVLAKLGDVTQVREQLESVIASSEYHGAGRREL